MAQTAIHQRTGPSVTSGLKNLARKKKHAVEAYQGGFMGFGKLAQVMGLSQPDMRRWLTEHGIMQNAAYKKEDEANA